MQKPTFPFLIQLKPFSKKRKKRRSSDSVVWEEAPDVSKQIAHLVVSLRLQHVSLPHVHVFRSFGSKAYARARIWAFPRIWQKALKLPPHYIIEVLAEKFDHLSDDDQKRVLIHELMHIPKNFSGNLVSHRGAYHRINSQTVEKLFRVYKKSLP